MLNKLSYFAFGAIFGLSLAPLLNEAAPVPTAAVQAPEVKVGPITKTSPISMPVRGPAKEMLKRNEGVHTKAYTDSEGNPTIGVGFNLTRPDASKRLRIVGATRESVLTATQIEALLDADLTDVLQDLVTLFPDFADMPEKAQLVLIDLRFNCGSGGLRTFVNTLRSIKTAQWHDAAERLELSQWATQVGARATRTIALLRGIS